MRALALLFTVFFVSTSPATAGGCIRMEGVCIGRSSSSSLAGGSTSGELLFLGVERGFDLADDELSRRYEAGEAEKIRAAEFQAARMGHDAVARAAAGGTSAPAAGVPAPASAPPPGVITFRVKNNRSETVEFLLDGKPTGHGLAPGQEFSFELLPPAELKARYGELKMKGGGLEVEWKETDLKPVVPTPGALAGPPTFTVEP